MNLIQFQESLHTYEGMENILSEYLPHFNRIEDYGGKFRNGMIQNVHDLDEAMTEATGIFTSIYPLGELLDAKVKWAQDKQAELKRSKTIGDIDADFLHYCRRMRAIFKGYARSAEQIISTCQSRLKNAEKEKIIG